VATRTAPRPVRAASVAKKKWRAASFPLGTHAMGGRILVPRPQLPPSARQRLDIRHTSCPPRRLADARACLGTVGTHAGMAGVRPPARLRAARLMSASKSAPASTHLTSVYRRPPRIVFRAETNVTAPGGSCDWLRVGCSELHRPSWKRPSRFFLRFSRGRAPLQGARSPAPAEHLNPSGADRTQCRNVPNDPQ